MHCCIKSYIGGMRLYCGHFITSGSFHAAADRIVSVDRRFFSTLFLLFVMKRHLNKRQMPSMGQFLLCFYGNSNSVRFSFQKKHARTNKTPNGNDCFRCIERICEYVRNHIDICAYAVEIGKPPQRLRTTWFHVRC